MSAEQRRIPVRNPDLTFKSVSTVNRARCQRWHPGFPGDDGWTGADWANAMQGEAGEAGNVVKKLRRIETGMLSARSDGERAELLQKLADEIGDVYAYLDLLAQFYGLDIEDCIRDKFNAVSIREGMPERIGDQRRSDTRTDQDEWYRDTRGLFPTTDYPPHELAEDLGMIDRANARAREAEEGRTDTRPSPSEGGADRG